MASSEGSELEQLDDFLEQAEEEIVDEENDGYDPEVVIDYGYGHGGDGDDDLVPSPSPPVSTPPGLGEMDRGHHRGLRLQVDHNMEVHK